MLLTMKILVLFHFVIYDRGFRVALSSVFSTFILDESKNGRHFVPCSVN